MVNTHLLSAKQEFFFSSKSPANLLHVHLEQILKSETTKNNRCGSLVIETSSTKIETNQTITAIGLKSNSIGEKMLMTVNYYRKKVVIWVKTNTFEMKYSILHAQDAEYVVCRRILHKCTKYPPGNNAKALIVQVLAAILKSAKKVAEIARIPFFDIVAA